jgi:hypothetical protein
MPGLLYWFENMATDSNSASGAPGGAANRAPDISSFIHKFRTTGNDSQQSSNKVSKRNRQPLSCGPCRQRKLKCNRQSPCETCIKREDESSCTYGKSAQGSKPEGGANQKKAQDRLRNLEQLVMQMVEKNSPPKTNSMPSTATSTSGPIALSAGDSDGTPRDGSLDQASKAAKYVGSTHWSAILENIQELKSAMVDDVSRPSDADEADEEQAPNDEVLFGSKRAIPLPQVLAQYLPPRLTVDRLLATYFNAKYMVIPYIHTYQFQRQYESFWQDQSSMSPQWVSILFSICCLASQLAQAVGGDSPYQEKPADGALFLTASAQCLILTGYTRPKPNLVEALALYAQCQYNTTLDPSGEVAIMFAILIRLAYRMGYHRDADNFTNFSVFEGEMRRRVWTMCRQFDLMVSFQLGLPNNIPLDSWDTKDPRNLLDTDFDETTAILPPSRPENEATQILYFIVKSRLMTNFGRICQHALSFKNSSQVEIMDLDSQVRATFLHVPQILRTKPMSQSFADPSYLIMVRLNCEFLYRKSLLVLHRKYMTQGVEESTKACLEAAMAIIDCFVDFNKEVRPGGALYNDRWMLGSFTMNDFLLAAMIVCLALSQWRKKNPGGQVLQDPVASSQMETLRVCYNICQERAPTSIESRKVANALRAMLVQLERGASSHTVGTPRNPATFSSGQHNQNSSTVTADMMDLTPLSFSETPVPPTATDIDTHLTSGLGPFGNFLAASEDIDWTFLDQYLTDPNRYSENEINQGIGMQSAGPADQADWDSVPYRFLGPAARYPRTQPTDPGEEWPQQEPQPLQPPGVGSLNLRTSGPENGFMPSY